jgi:hypothetical protein
MNRKLRARQRADWLQIPGWGSFTLIRRDDRSAVTPTCAIKAPGAAHGPRVFPLKAVDFEHSKWMLESGGPVSSSDFEDYWQLTDEAIRHEPLPGLSTLFRY